MVLTKGFITKNRKSKLHIGYIDEMGVASTAICGKKHLIHAFLDTIPTEYNICKFCNAIDPYFKK